MTVVDLITGFLGAGKTTFIKGYAEWLTRTGRSFCVIENEYGAAGVDAAYLKNVSVNAEDLSGGCICCSLKVGFHDALLRLSEVYDRVIVEPSGIFSPDDFFEVLRSPQVSARCRQGCAVTVCDVRMTRLAGDALDVFRQQLNAAGIVLVSKTQTASRAEVAACGDFIRENLENGFAAPVLTTDWHDFTDDDYEMISGAQPTLYEHTRVTRDHSALFSNTTTRPNRAYSEAELPNVLRGLQGGDCGAVLRVKGYLNALDGGSFQVNCTADDMEFVKLKRQVPPMMNIIGRGLNRKKIKEILMPGGET